jgi:DNA polymerase
LNKQAELDQIMADIIQNDVCPDLAKTAKNLVFGDGNPNADIVFIGEAPGKQEDEQGLPFVGASGKFLAEMLSSINLKREQVYITNIVKYRPPSNRDPLPIEKEAFLPYLERQLDTIQPLLVITLGRHSMNCFLPNLQISQAHGEPKRKDGRVFLPLFHPAAALYNGSLRQTLLDDFSRIPTILTLIRDSK